MSSLFRNDIPTEVRLSFIQALYGNRKILWFGLAAHVLTCLVIFIKTDDPNFLIFSVGFVLIIGARMFDMHLFDKVDFSDFDSKTLDGWEIHYLVGACAVCLLLGLLCFYSTYFSNNSFAELASLSILLASVVSIVGRNYASRLAVIMMSICALLPVLVGFVLVHSIFHLIVGLLLIPYFLSNIKMAEGLRKSLFAAVLNEHRLTTVIGRFDAALNNMPQGLIMLDKNGRVSVVNKQVREMLHIKHSISLRNRSFDLILRYCCKHGLFPRHELKNVSSRIDQLLSGALQRDVFQFGESHYIEVSCNHRREEGTVMIFDDVTGRIEAEAKIQHMARYDVLTGLPNRVHFDALVTSALHRNDMDAPVALAVLDINHFKHINDTYGHHTGDALLREFACRLSEMNAASYIPSRFGGDEFVLFIDSFEDTSELSSIMDEVAAAMSGTYYFDGFQIYIDVSMGVSVTTAAEASLRELHINADLALSEVKNSEEAQWLLFVEEMDKKYRLRQRLKNDLRQAIKEEMLDVVYQPIVSLNSLRLVSVEALSRWNHPELGSIEPAEYIPLAEEMGIITELTKYMLRKATKDCSLWQKQIGVSVNLSAIDLKNANIAHIIINALQNADLPANLLEVEVTESAIISDRLKTCEVLQRLKNLGINIALDDFGTGYSSLSYLNTLPLTKVKVDRSFVRDIVTDRRALMLMRGVIQLSHELGFGVTIEGVETTEQLALIRSAGSADLIQGYLLGKPLRADEITNILKTSLIIAPDLAVKK